MIVQVLTLIGTDIRFQTLCHAFVTIQLPNKEEGTCFKTKGKFSRMVAIRYVDRK